MPRWSFQHPDLKVTPTLNGVYGNFYTDSPDYISLYRRKIARRLGPPSKQILHRSHTPTTNSEYGDFLDFVPGEIIQEYRAPKSEYQEHFIGRSLDNFLHPPDEYLRHGRPAHSHSKETFNWNRLPNTDRQIDYNSTKQNHHEFDFEDPVSSRSSFPSNRSDYNRGSYTDRPMVEKSVPPLPKKPVLDNLYKSEKQSVASKPKKISRSILPPISDLRLPEIEAIELQLKDRSKLLLSLKEFYDRFVV